MTTCSPECAIYAAKKKAIVPSIGHEGSKVMLVAKSPGRVNYRVKRELEWHLIRNGIHWDDIYLTYLLH